MFPRNRNAALFYNETAFAALDIDYDTIIITTSKLKSLLNRCMDVILSDVYILRQISGKIPGRLIIKLTERALATNRVLSVSFLLKIYPNEEFALPLPDWLQNWSILHSYKKTKSRVDALKNIGINATVVVSAFMDIISDVNTCSNLRTVDLNKLPFESNLLLCLCSSIKENNSPHKEYIVTASYMFLEEDDFMSFRQAKKKCPPNVKLIVTGMHFMNNVRCFPEFLKLLNEIHITDLRFLCVDLVSHNLQDLAVVIPKFKNLNTLYLTYMLFTENKSEIGVLAHILYELPQLTRLGLKGSKLTNCLGTLFFKNCRKEEINKPKKQRTENDSNCCIAHRGKLQYLDLSACGLIDRDLECLGEYPLCVNVKYLNIGHNTFQTPKLANCLESMGSSIVLLDVESSIAKSSCVKPLLNVLSKLIALKAINMQHIKIEMHHLTALTEALFNMPSLKKICLSPLKQMTHVEKEQFIGLLKDGKGLDVICS